VFGRDGKIAKKFDNDNNEFGEEGFKYDKHIQPLVAKLLKGESGR
jgi:hypothetical protein